METTAQGIGVAPPSDVNEIGIHEIERRIAHRLSTLRDERGLTLQMLAERTGISRATLSRLERCELSPTAAMLSTLCGQYGWTLSRMMVEAEQAGLTIVHAKEQMIWKDPETGYERRVISPPRPDLKGELTELSLPAGVSISYGASYLSGLEHHLWMLLGSLSLELDGVTYKLDKGDCIRYVLSGPSKFTGGPRSARYVVATVRP